VSYLIVGSFDVSSNSSSDIIITMPKNYRSLDY